LFIIYTIALHLPALQNTDAGSPCSPHLVLATRLDPGVGTLPVAGLPRAAGATHALPEQRLACHKQQHRVLKCFICFRRSRLAFDPEITKYFSQ